MPSYLITGATSGLGRQVAFRLARQGGHQLILPSRDAARGDELQHELRKQGRVEVSTPPLDLSSLASVADFLRGHPDVAASRFDGVLLNAGVQSAKQLEFTVDGFESTFAVNHLAQFMLVEGLLPHLAPKAIVGWTASSTHDPQDKPAKIFGFRGAQYKNAEQVAQGDYGKVSMVQACRDAYATSKLCNIVTARAFGERRAKSAWFFSFDPGLMPGTGLARQQGRVTQWAWQHLMPRLASLLPGASCAEKSAAMLVNLLTGQLTGSRNGAYFNYTGQELEPASSAAKPWLAEDLLLKSAEMITRFRAVPA